jgi:hypothetical protein
MKKAIDKPILKKCEGVLGDVVACATIFIKKVIDKNV